MIYKGIEVDCLCAASPNSSMTGAILRQIFITLDKLGIAKRSEDCCPSMVLDGHITRMSEELLGYSTAELTKWLVELGSSYGSNHYQLHDDERMNGNFSHAMSDEKSKLVRKKRLHGLKPDIERHEIVLVVNAATERSFADKPKTKKALAIRGWNPPNRACLDIAEILETAPKEVKEERAKILQSRGNLPNRRNAVLPPPTETDLLTVGSGRIAGGAAASQTISATTQHLNIGTGRAAEILDMAHAARKRNEALSKVVASSNKRKSKEEIEKILSEARTVTAGAVIRATGGELTREVYNEVHRRANYKKEHEAELIKKKKKKMWDMKVEVDKIRKKFKQKSFKLPSLKVPELKTLCRWKKHADDKAIPTRKSDLIKRYKETKTNRTSRQSLQLVR